MVKQEVGKAERFIRRVIFGIPEAWDQPGSSDAEPKQQATPVEKRIQTGSPRKVQDKSQK